MATETQRFRPEEHFMKLKGKDYLPVSWRVVWFREEHADGYVATDLVEHDPQSGLAVFKARAGYANDAGREVYATGYGSETRGDFADYLEKSETKAIGRALAMLGYGTAQAAELDEGESVADSPVAKYGNKDYVAQRAPEQAARLPRTADPALLGLQRQLHEMAQHDREGMMDLWKYLEDHGKKRISELDAAETAERLMIFNDRAVTPQAAQEAHA